MLLTMTGITWLLLGPQFVGLLLWNLLGVDPVWSPGKYTAFKTWGSKSGAGARVHFRAGSWSTDSLLPDA